MFKPRRVGNRDPSWSPLQHQFLSNVPRPQVIDLTIHAKQQSEVVLSVSFLVAEQAVNLCIFATYISGQSRLKQKL